jgi:hypothetical protein
VRAILAMLPLFAGLLSPPHDFANHSWHDAPPAPLDVLAWLDQRAIAHGDPPWRDCVLFCGRDPPPPRARLIPTHSMGGPPALDLELHALHPLIRRCYWDAKLPRLKVTLVERPGLPLRVVTVDPPDAPSALVWCVTDVLTSEIVHPLHSTAPMVVVTGPA